MAMFNSYVSHYQRVSYSATLETPPPSSSTAPVAHGGTRFGASPWFWPRGNRVSLVVLLGVMIYDSYMIYDLWYFCGLCSGREEKHGKASLNHTEKYRLVDRWKSCQLPTSQVAMFPWPFRFHSRKWNPHEIPMKSTLPSGKLTVCYWKLP